jgi:hypothetical protein
MGHSESFGFLCSNASAASDHRLQRSLLLGLCRIIYDNHFDWTMRERQL